MRSRLPKPPPQDIDPGSIQPWHSDYPSPGQGYDDLNGVNPSGMSHPLDDTVSPKGSYRYVPPEHSRQRNPFGLVRTLSNAFVGGVVILGVLAGVGAWQSGERFFEGVRTILTSAPTEPEVDVRSVVVQQLRGASELTTAIFAMEAVVPTRSDRTLAGYVIGSTNLLYIAYGEVRAGVDLSLISEAEIVNQMRNSASIFQ